MKPSDLPYLLTTARLAGQAILEVYETDFEVQRKDDASPITEADLGAHRVITARLRERYSDMPILSEESTEQTPYELRRAWSRFWLVDPLDGTKEFVKRNGQFTVNIALIENSQPTLGVIYAPVLDRLYHGVVGRARGRPKVAGKRLCPCLAVTKETALSSPAASPTPRRKWTLSSKSNAARTAT